MKKNKNSNRQKTFNTNRNFSLNNAKKRKALQTAEDTNSV